MSSGSASGGAFRYASHSASASLTFSATSITWYTMKSASAGIARVYLDGKLVKTVDNYAASSQYKVTGYTVSGLSAGTHTIKIATSGTANAKSKGKLIHLDAFIVGSYRDTVALPATPSTKFRYTACPAATTTVSTAAQLQSALTAAKPGSVIRLNPGTYTAKTGFTLTVAGTSTKPVWVCGPRTAILTSGSKSQGVGIRVQGSSHVHLAGFTVANALQGVMVKGSGSVSVVDLAVRDIGYEAVHLYAFSSDGVVMHNQIARTGLVNKSYGEGVYIGTSEQRWSEVTGGRPDASDRAIVAFNDITAAGAEPIEAKAGTSKGQIHGNTIRGFQPGSNAIAWVLVTGNDWVVRANVGADAARHGYAAMSLDSWGKRNIFTGNRGTANSAGYGIYVTAANSFGVIVGCDNSVTAASSGLMNVICRP